MVEFFSSWAQGIIVAVIVATIVELLLPNGSSKKYVKVVVGIYILFSIIAPVVNKFANQDINTEIFNLDKYEKKMEDSNNKILQKIEANNSRTVKDIYVANLEADIKAKLKDKGFLNTEVRGNYSYITAIISEEEYREEQMRKMKDFWHDGSVKEMFQTLTKTITPEEKEELQDLIDDLD